MFDFGFTKFFTNTWLSTIWVLTVILFILTFLGSIGFLVYSMQNNPAPESFLMLGGLLLASLIYLISVRLSLEFVIVVFRIETHLRAIREKDENR